MWSADQSEFDLVELLALNLCKVRQPLLGITEDLALRVVSDAPCEIDGSDVPL